MSTNQNSFLHTDGQQAVDVTRIQWSGHYWGNYHARGVVLPERHLETVMESRGVRWDAYLEVWWENDRVRPVEWESVFYERQERAWESWVFEQRWAHTEAGEWVCPDEEAGETWEDEERKAARSAEEVIKQAEEEFKRTVRWEHLKEGGRR